jgi:hypothetical protein
MKEFEEEMSERDSEKLDEMGNFVVKGMAFQQAARI